MPIQKLTIMIFNFQKKMKKEKEIKIQRGYSIVAIINHQKEKFIVKVG